jgi:ATP-binding protein involved in chromosome partitioning
MPNIVRDERSFLMSSCAHGSPTGNQAQREEEVAIIRSLSRIKHKLVVMSGKGGVGKSSLAVNLALGLSMKGYKVGLMDVDLHGPSIPRMLGLNGRKPLPSHGGISPIPFSDHLKVISIEVLMPGQDNPVIWRGPLKIGVIRQFIADVIWGDLDYLVIDSPPGTGDEPLTVAQTIPEAQAIIVTTPQEIALSDVRKSINFCREVNLKIAGLVENMSGFICAHCGQESAIFKKEGGKRTALAMGLPFLGSIPFDMRLMELSDQGKAYLMNDPTPAVKEAIEGVIEKIIAVAGQYSAPVLQPLGDLRSTRKGE